MDPFIRYTIESEAGAVEAIMHETAREAHWHEPKAGEYAGTGIYKRLKQPYDLFMDAEGVPVYRGIGVRRVHDLPMAPWKRLGCRGSYIQLYGTEGLWGMYVAEVPGAGALNVEKHLYEKIVIVVEGRGSTEVWLDNSGSDMSSNGRKAHYLLFHLMHSIVL